MYCPVTVDLLKSYQYYYFTRMTDYMRLKLSLILCSVFFTATALAKEDVQYQVLETVSHDSSFFTQGLEISEGVMYESGGLYGKSRIRKYLPANDTALAETPLPDEFFAEGLTLLADEVFVLTWKEKTLFILNPDDLSIKREIGYAGEGWGLANNGKQLIMSNGSETIYFRNPATFEIEREINVYSQQHSVQRINELEYAEGYIWANIWPGTMIVKIEPHTGKLAGFYNLVDLVKKHSSGNDERVLNGIAYDKVKKAFWITGKLWPARYLIRFGQAQEIR